MARFSTALLLSGSLFCTAPLFAADVKVEVLQDKLQHPWSVAFLPDNKTLLITERSGQLRSWSPESGLSQPIQGVPKVWAERQSGLLDVVLAPDFATSRRVWLSYTEANSSGKAGAVVGVGTLSKDNRQLSDFREVIRQTPMLSSGNNIGTRRLIPRAISGSPSAITLPAALRRISISCRANCYGSTPMVACRTITRLRNSAAHGQRSGPMVCVIRRGWRLTPGPARYGKMNMARAAAMK